MKPLALASTLAVTVTFVAAAGAQSRAEVRAPWEIDLGLGLGNAVCDSSKPDSDCPVAGAGTFFLGGAWRFHPHWAVGLELAYWGYKVRESWRGQLVDSATDVKLSSAYIAALARWYWFDHGTIDPYLTFGLGVGSFDAKASNAYATYEFKASGSVWPLGIGVEWQLGDVFRLGPQLLWYLHVSNTICENSVCRSAGKNADGSREGIALPWRLALSGTFTLGNR
jgi:opacity protein-like surface antigen